MGRFLVLVVALLALAALACGIYAMIKGLRKRSKRRQQEQHQRDLANFAPAVLNGSPLVEVVIDQGRQLAQAAEILSRLTADPTEVYMSDDHRQRVSAWLNQHADTEKKG